MEFDPKKTLKDYTYNYIRDEILLGHLKPGDKLNIFQISQDLGVSTAPVREALNYLNKDGLVVLPSRKQAVISTVTLEDWKYSMFLRRCIEPYTAALSFDKIPINEIKKNKKILENVFKNPQNKKEYIYSDLQLHEMLYAYSDSHLLKEILALIRTKTIRLRYLPEKFENNESKYIEVTLQSTREHLGIINAILEKSQKLVFEAVLFHIDSYLRRFYDNNTEINQFNDNIFTITDFEKPSD